MFFSTPKKTVQEMSVSEQSVVKYMTLQPRFKNPSIKVQKFALHYRVTEFIEHTVNLRDNLKIYIKNFFFSIESGFILSINQSINEL